MKLKSFKVSINNTANVKMNGSEQFVTFVFYFKTCLRLETVEASRINEIIVKRSVKTRVTTSFQITLGMRVWKVGWPSSFVVESLYLDLNTDSLYVSDHSSLIIEGTSREEFMANCEKFAREYCQGWQLE